MQKFKKAIAVFLAGIMTLAMLTACGGTDGGKVQHVNAASSVSSSNPVKIGDLEIIHCSLIAMSTEQSAGKYEGYEALGVTFTIRNNSKMPLDAEKSYYAWSKLMFDTTKTYDERYSELFSQNSKYWTAKVDGNGVAVESHGMVMGNYDLATIPAEGGGVIQVELMAPLNWTTLELSFTPSNANGETVVFHLTQEDVGQRT